MGSRAIVAEQTGDNTFPPIDYHYFLHVSVHGEQSIQSPSLHINQTRVWLLAFAQAKGNRQWPLASPIDPK